MPLSTVKNSAQTFLVFIFFSGPSGRNFLVMRHRILWFVIVARYGRENFKSSVQHHARHETFSDVRHAPRASAVSPVRTDHQIGPSSRQSLDLIRPVGKSPR